MCSLSWKENFLKKNLLYLTFLLWLLYLLVGAGKKTPDINNEKQS